MLAEFFRILFKKDIDSINERINAFIVQQRALLHGLEKDLYAHINAQLSDYSKRSVETLSAQTSAGLKRLAENLNHENPSNALLERAVLALEKIQSTLSESLSSHHLDRTFTTRLEGKL